MKEIPLTQGKVALVDDADYEAVNAHKWYAEKAGRKFYATRNIRKSNGQKAIQRLHNFLMPGVPEVDHRDGDGLNNQREKNLRPATTRQNGRGFRRKRFGATSKFRGVSWHKGRSKWVAQIKAGEGKRFHLGLFKSEKEAALAYDEAARKYFGEFAHLNFPI